MGSGSWTTKSFVDYSTSKGYTTNASGVILNDFSAQENFKARRLDPMLDPNGVVRECCDSDEHPNTIPVVIALDVTGSMNDTAVAVAKKINQIMTDLYGKVNDIEFMIMGIGDLAYDEAPIQASQFESDIRIAEQLDLIWFENGGGGNRYESYSAAWFFGLHNTKLDCWKRNKKGILITIGDERLNPYLPKTKLENVLGISLQENIDTIDLYEEAREKFDIYHLDVRHGYYHDDEIKKSFTDIIPDNNFIETTIDNIANDISKIILQNNQYTNEKTTFNNNVGISW